jgi:hypothetical protein
VAHGKEQPVLHDQVDLELAEATINTVDATDLTPGSGTTYACAKPTPQSVADLMGIVLSAEPPFDPAELREKAHVTLVYSREAAVDLERLRSLLHGVELEATVEGFEYWDGHNSKGYVVAKLACPGMAELNAAFVEAGCVHSFDDFCAHMTVCAKVGPETDEVRGWLARATAGLEARSPLVLDFDRIEVSDVQ